MKILKITLTFCIVALSLYNIVKQDASTDELIESTEYTDDIYPYEWETIIFNTCTTSLGTTNVGTYFATYNEEYITINGVEFVGRWLDNQLFSATDADIMVNESGITINFENITVVFN